MSTFAVRAKGQELVVNFGRESATATTSVHQELVQVILQPDFILPQSGKGVGDPRKTLKQGDRPDLQGKACRPPRRNRQLLIKRLRASPTAQIRR